MFDSIKAGHPLYKIVRRPCNITTDDKLWYVSGKEKAGQGGGVIAWCTDSTDAKQVYQMVTESGLFSNIRWGKWNQGYSYQTA